jgi:uncharacterized protein YpmB
VGCLTFVAITGVFLAIVLMAAALFHVIIGPYRSTHENANGHDSIARVGAAAALATALVVLIEARSYRQALR